MSALAGKIALVTGAASGIGAAIARKLAAEGALVAINYRASKSAAEALAAGLGGAAFAGDVAVPEQAQSLADAIASHYGRIDILVNNAGLIEPAPFGAITPDSFQRQFAGNALSVLMMMQACVPYFPEAGGRVINISSSLALKPIENTAAYCASKAAVNALTQAFSRELGKRRITVNAIAPGATATPMTDSIPAEIKDRISAATPLGRWAVPEDIASMAAYLASGAAEFITGQIIVVDGGLI